MAGSNYYILMGGAEHLDFFEHNARYAGDQWFWTVPKGARAGEVGFVYLCAPVSRIVGRVEFIAKPFYNVGMFPEWADQWMAEVGNVVYFPTRHELTIRGLRELFSADWGWPRYPRSKTIIPADIVQPFLELVKEATT